MPDLRRPHPGGRHFARGGRNPASVPPAGANPAGHPLPPPPLPRVAAGERDAVDACIARYGAAVWWLATRYLGRRADAEDAVQEVFLDLRKSAARYDAAVAAERTFVTTVARRRLLDCRRRLAARPDRFAEPPADCRDDAFDPQGRAELADESARPRRELAGLPADQRRVIELAVDRGLTQAEIADRTGLPLGTVKSHARRGLRTLRDRLTRPAPPPPRAPAVPAAAVHRTNGAPSR